MGDKGIQIVTEMLNGLEPSHRERLLSNVQVRDPELAAQIRKRLLSFDSLTKLSDSQLQQLFSQVPQALLALALRAVKPEVSGVIFRNLPARAAEQIREEMLAQGPRRLSEVERAQAEILKLAQEVCPGGF